RVSPWATTCTPPEAAGAALPAVLLETGAEAAGACVAGACTAGVCAAGALLTGAGVAGALSAGIGLRVTLRVIPVLTDTGTTTVLAAPTGAVFTAAAGAELVELAIAPPPETVCPSTIIMGAVRSSVELRSSIGAW